MVTDSTSSQGAAEVSALVVYDQPALRESYVAAIRALTGLRVRAAASADEALVVMAERPASVALLDARLPRRTGDQPSYTEGGDLLRDLRQRWPRVPILVTSVVWTPYLLWSSVRSGAAGVLRDDADFPELAAAIAAALKTNRFRARDDEQKLAMMAEVNPTEQDRRILLMKREGMSHQDIAEVLGISRSTIRTHFQKLAYRLGVEGENEGAIVYRASELGLLQFP
jgi:DNA-binding NarL/FixJ family response regulator